MEPKISLEVGYDGVKFNTVVHSAEENIAVLDFARFLAREITALHSLARSYGSIERKKTVSGPVKQA